MVQTSKNQLPVVLPNRSTFSQSLVVFATSDLSFFAVLSSNVHLAWSIEYGATLETRLRYSPTDVFETFPMPELGRDLRDQGKHLQDARTEIMARRRLGLTSLYNLVNSPEVQDDIDVDLIRSIHVQIDEAVMEAYGWTDIRLDHGFHTYRQMERWTVNPAARVEILGRLLEENHRRAAIEARSKPKRPKSDKSFEQSQKPEGAMF